MKHPVVARLFLACFGLALVVTLSACATAVAPKKLKIAFLMPCTACSDRFENQDKPLFIAAVKEIDPSIEVIADNAQGSGETQLAQTDAALTNGANVIVTSPRGAEAGASIVAKASAQKVPVIAYDGMIAGGSKPDYYVSFQNGEVGKLQAKYLADNVKPGGTIVMINGSMDSAPGREFKAGAHEILDPLFKSGKLKLGYEGDTQGFVPATAQAMMEQALTALNDQVDGVLAVNDAIGGAVATALTARKLNGKVLVTGQDASDAGLQRLILGDQTQTVYKPLKQEALITAKMAVALAKGNRAEADALVNTKVNNGSFDVPSVLLTPVSVTKDNLATTVIADAFTTWARICVGDTAAKCPSK